MDYFLINIFDNIYFILSDNANLGLSKSIFLFKIFSFNSFIDSPLKGTIPVNAIKAKIPKLQISALKSQYPFSSIISGAR